MKHPALDALAAVVSIEDPANRWLAFDRWKRDWLEEAHCTSTVDGYIYATAKSEIMEHVRRSMRHKLGVVAAEASALEEEIPERVSYADSIIYGKPVIDRRLELSMPVLLKTKKEK